jgi:hypothetical protein
LLAGSLRELGEGAVPLWSCIAIKLCGGEEAFRRLGRKA